MVQLHLEHRVHSSNRSRWHRDRDGVEHGGTGMDRSSRRRGGQAWQHSWAVVCPAKGWAGSALGNRGETARPHE
jgi:hypothetical protein